MEEIKDIHALLNLAIRNVYFGACFDDETYALIEHILEIDGVDLKSCENCSSSGNTCILDACEIGDYEVVKRLFDAGADVNSANQKTGDTCLMVACKARNPESCRFPSFYFCQNFDKVMRFSSFNVRQNSDKVMKLIAMGADVTAVNLSGNNALDLYIECNHGHIEFQFRDRECEDISHQVIVLLFSNAYGSPLFEDIRVRQLWRTNFLF